MDLFFAKFIAVSGARLSRITGRYTLQSRRRTPDHIGERLAMPCLADCFDARDRLAASRQLAEPPKLRIEGSASIAKLTVIGEQRRHDVSSLSFMQAREKVLYPRDDELAMKRFVGEEAFDADFVKFQVIYLCGLPTEYDVRHDVEFVLELEGEKAEQTAPGQVSHDLPLLFRALLDLDDRIASAQSLDRPPHHFPVLALFPTFPGD